MSTSGLPVLVYHGITDETCSSLSEYSVSPQAFADQMAYLAAKGYTTISPLQVVNHAIDGTPLPDRAIAITFDDGFLDTYLNALPVLTRYNFTATVFVVAERVGQCASWESTPGETAPALMSWQQIRDMARQGISIGAHSCTHPDLTQLSVDVARREIDRSRQIIEENIDGLVQFFAYPHSRFNYTVRELVVNAGFCAAFSTHWGLTGTTNDLFALNRMMVLREHDLGYFKWMVDLGVKHPWYFRIFKGKKTAVRKLLKPQLLRR